MEEDSPSSIVELQNSILMSDAYLFEEGFKSIINKGDEISLALNTIIRLGSVPENIRSQFFSIWIESNGLPLRLGCRRKLAKALPILLPKSTGPKRELKVFRGTQLREHCLSKFGFSWTTDFEIARRFAKSRYYSGKDRTTKDDGVILSVLAPIEAILLVRDDPEHRLDGYYDEAEVIIDPFKLPEVEIVERICC